MNYTRMELLASPGVVRSASVYDPRRDARLRAADHPLPVPADARRDVDPEPAQPESREPAHEHDQPVRAGRRLREVTVPAGTFDAIAMRVMMSVDDNNPFRFPTSATT